MVERRFAREVGSLEAIFDFVTEFAARHQLSEDQRFEVDLVLEELFTNLVKYSSQRVKKIAIGLDRRGPELTLVMRDFDAEEFDITGHPPEGNGGDSAVPRAGGRGLALVRRYADEFRYDYHDRNGTITVTKRLDR
jgi:anti-sigma regulatory factor (Ser/Thr protein kinase)